MTRNHHACGSAEHTVERRKFLGTLVAGLGATVLGSARRTLAEDLVGRQKRMLVVYLVGGSSQFETWDPKPGAATGGPFRAIPTSVPGIHLSELLPNTARQMHHLSLVRSLNTNEDEHGRGATLMLSGRRTENGAFPHVGAVAAKTLGSQTAALPGHILISQFGNYAGVDAAYLGSRYSSMLLADGNPPKNMTLPKGVSADSAVARNHFRDRVNARFASRRTTETDAYTHTFDQALRFMERTDAFDLSKEPERDHDRYGRHDFGRHCLLARRMLEQDVPFVQVSHGNFDTHAENFDYHLEQVGEFDRGFGVLIEDLAERGLLEHTLVVVMSEFGRTPHINVHCGRDHWSKSWSIALGGAGIQPGAVVGKSSADGMEVADRQVDQGHLFHTYLQALGIDSTGEFEIDGRRMPMADPAREAIKELLA